MKLQENHNLIVRMVKSADPALGINKQLQYDTEDEYEYDNGNKYKDED